MSIPGFGYDAEEKDYGVCLHWACPECRGDEDFHLVVREPRAEFLGVEMNKFARTMDLRCAGCGFEVRVAEDEGEPLAAVRELTGRLKRGALGRPAYEESVRGLSAAFLAAVIDAHPPWKCPACGEEIPTGFDACWNCGRRADGTLVPEPEDPGEDELDTSPGRFEGGG